MIKVAIANSRVYAYNLHLSKPNGPFVKLDARSKHVFWNIGSILILDLYLLLDFVLFATFYLFYCMCTDIFNNFITMAEEAPKIEDTKQGTAIRLNCLELL